MISLHRASAFGFWMNYSEWPRVTNSGPLIRGEPDGVPGTEGGNPMACRANPMACRASEPDGVPGKLRGGEAVKDHAGREG